MKFVFKQLLIIFMANGFFSCGTKVDASHKKDQRLETWYNRIKSEIIGHSKQKEDSIAYNLRHGTLFVTYFQKGNRLREEWRSSDTSQLRALTRFGRNNLFELRSELTETGREATEGILYDDMYYGPWTVWYDNGQTMNEGYRNKNIEFGDWIYYTETVEVKKQEDKGRSYLADSILSRENLHTSNL